MSKIKRHDPTRYGGYVELELSYAVFNKNRKIREFGNKETAIAFAGKFGINHVRQFRNGRWIKVWDMKQQLEKDREDRLARREAFRKKREEKEF